MESRALLTNGVSVGAFFATLAAAFAAAFVADLRPAFPMVIDRSRQYQSWPKQPLMWPEQPLITWPKQPLGCENVDVDSELL